MMRIRALAMADGGGIIEIIHGPGNSMRLVLNTEDLHNLRNQLNAMRDKGSRQFESFGSFEGKMPTVEAVESPHPKETI